MVIESIDLKAINCNFTQGDNYCEVSVNKDGTIVQLHTVSSKDMYVYKIKDNALVKSSYKPMKTPFKLIPTADEINQNLSFYSTESVRFSNGDYGYLVSKDFTLRTLEYIRNGKAYHLFNAKNGIWDVVATPTKHVPESWFPKDFSNIKVLCLAGGGGQQGPIFAALGAEVVVFDNCKKQLEKDEFVAQRDGLKIKTIHGDMKDLSALKDETFDFIMQFAGAYVDTVLPVWKEAYRVLKKGGTMVAGHNNPIEFIFDLESMEKGKLVVRHKIPYSDMTSLTKEEFEKVTENEGISFGHSLEDLIQGQIDAGFLIAGFYEDVGCSPLDKYIPTFFATKAIKL